jgi:hypothetical protein
VDGELSGPQRAAFEAEMAADPALARAVEQHRRLTARIASAYAPVLEEPVPPRLIAVASAANDRGRPAWGAPQWAAMAACLVVGVAAGRVLWPQPGPLASHGGVLVAQGGLAKALTSQLASDGGPVTVGLTFRARDGGFCRTFRSTPDRLAGLACRQGDRWVAETATAWSPPERSGGYRAAASETPPAVLAAVDAAIAGDPLDAAAERAARDRGWTP